MPYAIKVYNVKAPHAVKCLGGEGRYFSTRDGTGHAIFKGTFSNCYGIMDIIFTVFRLFTEL